jgi:hypothetical protein
MTEETTVIVGEVKVYETPKKRKFKKKDKFVKVKGIESY